MGRFWLDGELDYECVEACRYHPDHQWLTIKVKQAIKTHPDPNEEITYCRCCGVPRCRHVTKGARCTLWQHHEASPHRAHRLPSGALVMAVGSA